MVGLSIFLGTEPVIATVIIQGILSFIKQKYD